MRSSARRAGDERHPLTDGRVRDIAGQAPPPRPPLRFICEDAKSGVRVTIINDGPLGGRLHGAVRYDVYWAEEVDTATADGKAAGFARATALAPSIPATTVDHTPSSGFFSDPKYAAGYFYVCGVGADGERSEPSEPAQVVTGPIDHTIPGDVKHLSISESGKTSNGTVMSELSVTCEPPEENISNFGGVQLYLKDYLAIGDIQEGAFHKWNGSGGIAFAPLYPIPRRRSSVSVTVTNGSPNVTAASGLLAVAKDGEQFEFQGKRHDISTVTDTQITLTANWGGVTQSTTEYVIIAKPTIYAVSVSKAGTRRDDVENAPSQDVLMDGELSAPPAPSGVTAVDIATGVRVMWTQNAGSTTKGYNVYRSPGSAVDPGMSSSPPRPSVGTFLMGAVEHNPNLATSATSPQFDDTNFFAYDLESNATFRWYVTAINARGDESAASSYTASCRTARIYEFDPSVPGARTAKNYLYNAGFAGTAVGAVVATDTAQDAFIGTDASNLPGVPYGVTTAQADGSGKFRGYTRWEAVDGGTGAAGTVRFQNGDEIHIPAPGAGKAWYILQELGAWDHGTAAFRKIGKGYVYALSIHLNHDGVATNGTVTCYLEQYDNNTLRGQALRRYRNTNSDIVTDSTGLDIAGSDLTVSPVRYQAAFQMDESLGTTRQLRVNFAWIGGTTGTVVLRRAGLNDGEFAALWTPDMRDPSISIPVPSTVIPPLGDAESRRVGEARRIEYEP